VAFSIEWNALFNGAFVEEVARSSSYQEIASCTAADCLALLPEMVDSPPLTGSQ